MERNGTGQRDSSRQVDLVVFKNGEATVVIEAKDIPVAEEYRRAVLAQVRHYAQLADSRWTLLVDPISVQVFARDHIEKPIAIIPSNQVLGWAGIDPSWTIGEGLLLLAVERWLTDKERLAELPHQFPELAEFAHDVSESEEILADVAI